MILYVDGEPVDLPLVKLWRVVERTPLGPWEHEPGDEEFGESWRRPVRERLQAFMGVRWMAQKSCEITTPDAGTVRSCFGDQIEVFEHAIQEFQERQTIEWTYWQPEEAA